MTAFGRNRKQNVTFQRQYKPRHQSPATREVPTYENEREDLKNRLNRQLRRLRALDTSERFPEQGTLSHYYTTEMAYMLDDIERGPVFFAPALIRKANDLVADLESQITKMEATKKG